MYKNFNFIINYVPIIKKVTSLKEALEFIHEIKYISPYASASDLLALGKFFFTI